MNTTMDDGFAPGVAAADKQTAPAGRPEGHGRLVTRAIALVVALGIGFAGGMLYQKGSGSSLTAANDRTPNGQFGGPGGNGMSDGSGMRRMGGFGTVSAVSDSSINIKSQRSGETTVYAITSATKITNNGETAAVGDIKTGDTVMIRTTESTGSTGTSSATGKQASEIILNPSLPSGRSGASGTGSQQPGGSSI